MRSTHIVCFESTGRESLPVADMESSGFAVVYFDQHNLINITTCRRTHRSHGADGGAVNDDGGRKRAEGTPNKNRKENKIN